MSNTARWAVSALLLCALTACGGADNTVPVKQEAASGHDTEAEAAVQTITDQIMARMK